MTWTSFPICCGVNATCGSCQHDLPYQWSATISTGITAGTTCCGFFATANTILLSYDPPGSLVGCNWVSQGYTLCDGAGQIYFNMYYTLVGGVGVWRFFLNVGGLPPAGGTGYSHTNDILEANFDCNGYNDFGPFCFPADADCVGCANASVIPVY